MRLTFSLAAAFCLAMSLCGGLKTSATKIGPGGLHEQALFAGVYAQNHIYGDGAPINVPASSDSVVRFDVSERAFETIPENPTDEYVYSNHLYSSEHLDHAFVSYDDSIYYGEVGSRKTSEECGPKEPWVNSTLKIRAYYHDVATPFGNITAMYDFSGFLVGDSLAMTTAHGLLLDVTSGIFDDGVNNLYMPGKIEVYGAIGLADEWGSAYRYYSLCSEVFFDSEYAFDRRVNADWAVLRLNEPLGRELSYRVLRAEAAPFAEMSIAGYPSWNQSWTEKIAENGRILSSYGQFCYETDTEDGMSGSPIFDPREEASETHPIRLYDSDGHSFLSMRAAYGIHSSYDAEGGLGFGVRFTSEIVDLVDMLNRRYRPSEVDVLGALGNSPLSGNARTEINEDYGFETEMCSVSFSGLGLSFSPTSGQEATCAFSFDFPIRGISFGFLPNDQSEAIFVRLDSVDVYGMEYSSEVCDVVFGTQLAVPSETLSISVRNAGLTLTSLIVEPAWGYVVESTHSPVFDADEIEIGSDNNCVSYALRNVVESRDSDRGLRIIPLTEDGYPSMQRPLDVYPGKIVSLFQERLLRDFDCILRPIGKYEACTNGGNKIAIVCDAFNYYHFLRLNRNGVWSHFLVNSGVSALDIDGNLIANPEGTPFANFSQESVLVRDKDRTYMNTELLFDATIFVGYFEVYAL